MNAQPSTQNPIHHSWVWRERTRQWAPKGLRVVPMHVELGRSIKTISNEIPPANQFWVPLYYDTEKKEICKELVNIPLDKNNPHYLLWAKFQILGNSTGHYLFFRGLDRWRFVEGVPQFYPHLDYIYHNAYANSGDIPDEIISKGDFS